MMRHSRPQAFALFVVASLLSVWIYLSSDHLGLLGVILLGAVLVVASTRFYFLLLGPFITTIFLRALFAFIPVGAFASAVIWFLAKKLEGDEGLIKALIAGVVVSAGWVVTFITSEWRRVAIDQERRRDLIMATIRELDILIRLSDSVKWDQLIEDVKSKFYADRRYPVFVMYGHEYGTLKRLVEQVEILQKDQIPEVMDLFQLLDRIDGMEEKLNSDAFGKLTWERRQEGVVRHLKLNSQVADFAEKARFSLKKSPFRGLLKDFL